MKQLKQFCVNMVYCAAGLGLFAFASTGASFYVPAPKTVTVTVPFSP